MNSFKHYDKPENSGQLPQLTRNEKLNDPALYRPTQGLRAAVDVALNLGMPLLLTGDPGTGKTELAYHIAHFFGLKKPYRMNAQTTSQARDLFYRYDALAHFQFSQTQKQALSDAEVEQRFIKFEALGEAIVSKKRAVVLIDEIDKAPRDLPNDVLAALENLEFKVAETGKEYKSEENARPIVIITSNSEKNLPDAFLRRVVYYHIQFPDDETLLNIVHSKISGFDETEIGHIVRFFRKIYKGEQVNLRKKPATAELIQWADLLHKYNFPVAKLSRLEDLSDAEEKLLKTTYSVLAKSREDLKALEDKF